jgi:riboflavin kinase/FMN adenylyltransferase
MAPSQNSSANAPGVPARIVRGLAEVEPEMRGAVVALGNFDGVHKGHQAVVAAARARATELGVPLGVVSFEPHPRSFFNPGAPEFRLTPLPSKARALGRLGVDFLAALPFDAAMANMLAQDFVTDVLVHGLGIVHVVIGFDFCFGRGRAGNAEVLAWMGEMEGFGLTVVEPQTHDGEVYSSTLIRRLLADGKPRQAARLMGHWWHIEGPVLPGDQRGRTIGFPTANIALEGYLHPALGVYAVRAEVDGRTFGGVANFGKRPTFDKKDVLLEVHLFDYSGDLYGKTMVVSFIEFLRPERKFAGLDELKAQIAADGAKARGILADPAYASVD